MSVDGNGNVHITGYFSSGDFDPGTEVYNMSSVGGYDSFILKLDPGGNFIWAKQFGGISSEYSYGIFADAEGNTFLTGKFYDTADFDPGPGIYQLTPVKYFDVFILALDTGGSFLWAKSFGGTGDDYGTAITKDKSGNVYTTGVFRATVDFDTGAGITELTSVGYGDYFLQKLKPCINTLNSITETACGSYTAPDGTVHTTSGIKTAVIPNAAGCDSTITIDLTINYSTAASITRTACGSYTAPDGTVHTTSGIRTAVIPTAAGCDSTITIDLTIITVDVSVSYDVYTLSANATEASYQWLDCGKDYQPVTGEINRSFTATSNGSYAVVVTQGVCADTSECIPIVGVSIMENTFDSDVFIYPNPTRGLFHIDVENHAETVDIIISDMQGHIITSQKIKNEKLSSLNIGESAGIYIITIVSGEKRAVMKLVKY